MSINKNAYIRYQRLDKCFKNFYKKYFIEDLLEAVNQELAEFNGYDSEIKKRQLFDDIRFMESEVGWAIPLERIKEGKKVYYRYSDQNFSIVNQKITDNEIDTINSALMVLVRFKGLPQFEWINEIIPKIQSGFKFKNQPEIISFDHNEFLKGLEFLPGLHQAIFKQTVLEISYQSFNNKEIQIFVIHPYYLKQFNKRWFLFGIIDKDNFLINLALDRINSFKQVDIKYKKNTLISFNDYFEDIVGVTKNRDKELTKIRLKFNSVAAKYVQTKPIHGSQKKIGEDENGLIIEIEVIPNYELRQLILYYGDSIEVISPEFYRIEIANIISKMNEKYFDKNE